MINTLRHVGIVVEDEESALFFWRDLLGFSVFADNLEKGPFIDSILGKNNIIVRTIKLQDFNNQCIELLHFQNSCNESPESTSLFKPGLTHVALQVSDLHRILAKLEKNGYKPISQPQISPNGLATVVFVVGPENLYLELVELS